MLRSLPALCRLLAFALAAGLAQVALGQPVDAGGPLPDPDRWSHAYAAYGKPKYPRGFAHFDYVNPDAPKGGTLQLNNPDRRTSFDKFNPFTIKGSSPAGLTMLMFETLAVRSGDEPDTMYGLVAEDIQVAPDKSSITFRINPEGALQQRRPGDRGRRQASRSTC